MRITHLVTHSGRFHADDVCAAAVLGAVFPEAMVVRTRDDDLISRLAPTAVTFDVGRTYDPEMNRFDHHMRDAAKRDDGITYSSFGLIWKAYGMLALEQPLPDADKELRERVFERFDREIVRPIDMMDNGHLAPADLGDAAGISLSAIIDRMNGSMTSPIDAAEFDQIQLGQFRHATLLAQTVFLNQFLTMEADILNERAVRKAIEDQWGGELLELDLSQDAQRVIDDMGASHVRMILQPSSSGGFGLTVARRSADSYDSLMDFPASWGGLSGRELADITGVEGATFCHSALFFVAASSRDAALELARLALEPSADPAPSF